MIGPGIAGSSFDAYVSGFEAGLVGTLTFSIETDLGVVVLAPTTAGIVEIDAGGTFSIYKITETFPATVGDYVVIWENPNTGVQGAEELVVGSVITPVTPEPVVGPCGGAWLELEDIADCCDAIEGSDVSGFTNENVIATNVLWRLSGRQYGGVCERTVRPCSTEDLCGFQVLSRGHIVDTGGARIGVGWNQRDWGMQCGCRPLSRVLLPGYPVREIIEVKIDGDVVSPSTYQIVRRRWLTRVRDPLEPDTALRWPSCQAMDLEDDQEGTFSVRYLSGVAPPPEGIAAAAALACEIHKACSSDDAALDGCQLPRGVTRVERQGVVFDIQNFTNWGYANGRWQSGIPLVDLFLNSVNPSGIRRRAAVWGPDGPHYAQPAGV